MAGTVTVTEDVSNGPIKKIQWSWTSTAGGAADLITSLTYNGIVLSCVTDPGSTAPDDNYDITITDPDSYDILQGAGANRDTTTTETCAPTAKSAAVGKLTLNVTNAGSAKVGVVTLFILGTAAP